MHIRDTNDWGKIKDIRADGAELAKDFSCRIYPSYVRGDWRVELFFEETRNGLGFEESVGYPEIVFERKLEHSVVPRDVTVDLNFFFRSVNDLGGTALDPMSRLQQVLSLVLAEKAKLVIDGTMENLVFFRLDIGGWAANASRPRNECLDLFAER